LTAGLVIPVGEELFFRGFVLTAWLRDLGERGALIRSSLFFALIHVVNISTDTFAEGAAQALLQTAVILPVGFAFGWLFLRYGMAAAIAAHVTYNSLLLFLAYLATALAQPA
jgi:membrane protease YdiL (CAAX protease family)